MTILIDNGNRWVGNHEGRKCTNCYLYGADCVNCEGTNCHHSLMTFQEFKDILSGVELTYEEFNKMSLDDFFRLLISHCATVKPSADSDCEEEEEDEVYEDDDYEGEEFDENDIPDYTCDDIYDMYYSALTY